MSRIYSILLLAAIIGSIYGLSNETMNVCWRESYDRGNGSIPNYCENGTEQSGRVCLSLCEDDYTAAGPICVQNCPSNYTDKGFLCVIPGDAYFPCCSSNCDCKEGYEQKACACYKVPEFLAKKTHQRDVSSVECEPPKVQDARTGLCYEECKADFVGIGGVCWQNSSGSSGYANQCNDVAFGQTDEDCQKINAILKRAGIQSSACLGFLAISIATGHPVGEKVCRDLIKNVLPQLADTPVC